MGISSAIGRTHWHDSFPAIRAFAVFVAAITALIVSPVSLAAQSPGPAEQIRAHIAAGEFPNAIALVDTLPTQQADIFRQQIATAQSSLGARAAAFKSAGAIADDVQRSRAITVLASYMPPPNESSAGNSPTERPAALAAGRLGGITEADFFPLIELIKTTINPDSWDDSNGDGTIQAYPSGVYVDSLGLLKKLKVDPANSMDVRASALKDSGNRRTNFPSNLRKVSLTRLERAAQLAAAQGRRLDEDMLNLAGIYSVQYVMLFEDSGEVVIAGPAGPWTTDSEGRPVNKTTGRPVLQLDDLVVCLRNAYENNGKFGCAITPREQNLAETKRVLETSNKRGKAWRDLLRNTLGRQDVSVFGVDPQTHAGRVLVEADYRMKLVGMGLEPSIPEIPSYLSRVELQPDGTLPPMDVVRWWFTLNYDDVTTDENHETFSFAGKGVKVLSENEMIDDLGRRIHTGTSTGPTREFAQDFTQHFEQIAAEYPIYNQLKNIFDLALVTSLIRHQGLAERANWKPTFFGNDGSQLTYQPELESAPREVDSVVNHRIISERQGSSTLRHTVVGVSGGIRFDALEVISADAIKFDARLSVDAAQARPGNATNWWWD